MESRRRKKICVRKLCNEKNNTNEFACKKLECKNKSDDRRDKRECIGNLCNEDNYADEFLCQKINEKTKWRGNKRRQSIFSPWKRINSPIPKKLIKQCRDESAEQKDECILSELEEVCEELKETEYDDDIPNACKCIRNENYEDNINGLKLCVKEIMIDYCRTEDAGTAEKFECRKFNKCGNIEDKYGRRKCVKALCKEEEFADTCHCKRTRRKRRKCFKGSEEEEE